MTKEYAYHEISSEEIKALLTKRASFVLTNVTSMNQSVQELEAIIEGEGLSCRIYTAGRSASMAATFSPAALWGIASAAAIAAHNLATLNPDYEVAKYPVTDKLEVNFKK
ncbi:MAG: hypothetical protein ABG776_05310 [Cyanobacteria bacterium J06555_13]